MEIITMTGKTFTKYYTGGWCLALTLLLCFVAQITLGAPYFDLFELNSEASNLRFAPWSLLTYAFLHHDYWHFGINLLLLMAILLIGKLASKEIWILFLVSVILGGICFVSLPIERGASIIGASGGISALIVVAIQRMWGTKKWWLIILLLIVGVDWLSRGNDIESFAIHLCGYCVGAIYVFSKKMNLLSSASFERPSKEFEEVVKKVEVSGYHSLSREEKATLFD